MPDAPKPPLIQKIRLENILSFGEPMELELKPLNVLIGPNGSGKSNFIDIFGLLRAATFGDKSRRSMRDYVASRGGVAEWRWKGNASKKGFVRTTINYGEKKLTHEFEASPSSRSFFIDDEVIKLDEHEIWRSDFIGGYLKYFENGEWLDFNEEEITPQASILAEGLPDYKFKEIGLLTQIYEHIELHRDWTLGTESVLRLPVKTDERGDILEEDYSNLILYLNNVTQNPRVKRKMLDILKKFYSSYSDILFPIVGGTVHMALVDGDFTIPASRLSDGTLRILSLLAILCSNGPSRIVCIEEPEVGLHPDVLPVIANLLIEASSHMQLIVTTHSDILIDALTATPEVVVVCEKYDGSTTMRRLDGEQLKPWLKKYRLGQLWTKGEIGGTRW